MPAQLQRRLLIFAALLTLVAGSLFAHWLLIGRFIESTDNAYVQAEITRVSSQLSARVAKVLVGDNQHVQKSDLLLELEADDFRLALDRARAALATREAEQLQARSKLTQQARVFCSLPSVCFPLRGPKPIVNCYRPGFKFKSTSVL